MKTVDEAEALRSRLTRGEKARLLQRVAQDLGDAYPGVAGSSEADLLRSYPALRAEDLANAWAYVRSHREQISAHIREHEAA